MSIATLIASERLSAGDIATVRDAIHHAGGQPHVAEWIDDGIAADVPFARLGKEAARAALEGLIDKVDVIVQPVEHRRKRLLVADMDSTMITVECIDELADYAGIKPHVAEITERAMRGELDFEAALDARVALLKGLDAGVIDRCREERVRLMPGASSLVRTMRAQGGRAILVSGGFTHFADAVAQAIGFDKAVANILVVEEGRLAGRVTRPIVGAAAKLEVLEAERAAMHIPPELVLAVGDGANDIPMIEAAGLGVAYHAKPATAAAAGARVDACDLTALLHAQGYPRREWVLE